MKTFDRANVKVSLDGNWPAIGGAQGVGGFFCSLEKKQQQIPDGIFELSQNLNKTATFPLGIGFAIGGMLRLVCVEVGE